MAEPTQDKSPLNVEQLVTAILNTIEREREREIVSRRFGLFDRKETLEQIGELLGITRERVRQLEKAIVTRLKASGDKLPHINEVQTAFIERLESMGSASRVNNLAAQLTTENTRIDQARVAFLAELCPKVAVLDENDFFYHAVGITDVHVAIVMKEQIGKIIESIKTINEPSTIDKIALGANIDNPKQAEALASISKQLATLNGRWGLVRWPMVNPKNCLLYTS